MCNCICKLSGPGRERREKKEEKREKKEERREERRKKREERREKRDDQCPLQTSRPISLRAFLKARPSFQRDNDKLVVALVILSVLLLTLLNNNIHSVIHHTTPDLGQFY